MRTFKNYTIQASSIALFIIVSFTFLFIQSCKTDKKEMQLETAIEEKDNFIKLEER